MSVPLGAPMSTAPAARRPYLRPWNSADAPALRAARASDADLAVQFGGAGLTTDMECVDYIGNYLAFADNAKNFAIVLAGTVVGNIGMTAIDMHHQTAWMSYWLAASARGQMLATRGLVAVCDYAFANELFRLELGHRTNNPASCRVATRAGFISEGIQRQHLRYGEQRYDVELHARLATDPIPNISALEIEVSESLHCPPL